MRATQFWPGQSQPADTHRLSAVDALTDATHWVTGTLGVWRRRIRERTQLSRLDLRMLQDIGLTEADREFLASKPFWRE